MKNSIMFFIVWGLIMIVAVAFNLIRRNGNIKKAHDGEDKNLIKEKLRQIFNEDVPFVYAHYENQESYGRTVRTTYFRYIVVFLEKTLQVFPVRIDKKTREVQLARPFVLTTENLGKITVQEKMKNDQLKRLDVWLGDKQGHCIVEFEVDSTNLRKSKWFPVNLVQEKEGEEFKKFITSLAQVVAKENPQIDLIIANEANEGLGTLGMIVSIIGIFVGVFLPPLGLIISIIGFVMSLVGKLKGSSNRKSFIICTVCMIWSMLFCIFYIAVMLS